jgi:hypothetical protein
MEQRVEGVAPVAPNIRARMLSANTKSCEIVCPSKRTPCSCCPNEKLSSKGPLVQPRFTTSGSTVRVMGDADATAAAKLNPIAASQLIEIFAIQAFLYGGVPSYPDCTRASTKIPDVATWLAH